MSCMLVHILWKLGYRAQRDCQPANCKFLELKELLGMHGPEKGQPAPKNTGEPALTLDEVTIMKGALDMKDKVARYSTVLVLIVMARASIRCAVRSDYHCGVQSRTKTIFPLMALLCFALCVFRGKSTQSIPLASSASISLLDRWWS